MARPSLQLVAARVIREVIDQGRSLDAALAEGESQLKPREHGALREICYGGCRYYGYLDGLLRQLMDKPLRRKDRVVHFVLVAGLYQIIHMRVPDHAAVNQAVAALGQCRQTWARGLVNGVLRQYLRFRDEGNLGDLDNALDPASLASLPDHFYQWIAEAWPEQVGDICRAMGEKPPLTLRINQLKTTRDNYLALLAERKIPGKSTAESPLGIQLLSPMNVEDIPMFVQGWVSVQDESAQLCLPALKLDDGLRILDACAAPGGKTCAMLESVADLRLTAIDLETRVHAIQENFQRLGLDAQVCAARLQDYALEWDQEPFDRILLDAPCSGSGVIRRHPDIRFRRQPDDLQRFASQQLELLEAAWPMLSDTGVLLYVTCSILPAENDAVIDSFVRRNPRVKASRPEEISGCATRYGIQRLPGLHDGDGFYYCLLGKL